MSRRSAPSGPRAGTAPRSLPRCARRCRRTCSDRAATWRSTTARRRSAARARRRGARIEVREMREVRGLARGRRHGAVVGMALVRREGIPRHDDVRLHLADDAHELTAQLARRRVVREVAVGVAERDHALDAEHLRRPVAVRVSRTARSSSATARTSPCRCRWRTTSVTSCPSAANFAIVPPAKNSMSSPCASKTRTRFMRADCSAPSVLETQCNRWLIDGRVRATRNHHGVTRNFT